MEREGERYERERRIGGVIKFGGGGETEKFVTRKRGDER